MKIYRVLVGNLISLVIPIFRSKENSYENIKPIPIYLSALIVLGMLVVPFIYNAKANASAHIIALKDNIHLEKDYFEAVSDLSFKEKMKLINKAQDVVDEYADEKRALEQETISKDKKELLGLLKIK